MPRLADRVRIAAAGVLIAAAPLLADDAARLSHLERAAAAPGLSARDRLSLAEEADRLRAAMIEAHPEDERAPTWLVDRAASALQALAVDAADTSVLLGLPSDEQRRRVREAVSRARELLDRADAAAAERVEALERTLLGAVDSADAADRVAEAERLLSVLVDTEQTRRIPYYRGVAAALEAGAAEDAAIRSRIAHEAAAQLAGIVLPTLAGEAARRTLVGATLLNASNPDRAIQDAAAQQFRWVEERASTEEGRDIDALTRQRARMGLRLIGLALGAPAGEDWWTRLLDAEASARVLLAEARLDPQRRTELMGRALAGVLGVLRTPAPEGADPDALRLLVFAKVAAAADPGINLSDLPAEVAFARAITLRVRNERSMEAAALLEQVADRADAAEHVRADALWELAAAETDPSRRLASLLRIVRSAPGSPRAVDAARRIIEAPRADAAAREEMIEFLLAQEPTPELWGRALRARFARVLQDPSPETTARAAEAAERLGLTPESADPALLASLRERLAAPALKGPARLHLASFAREWAARYAPDAADGFALAHAEALIAEGDPRALAAIRELVERPSPPLEPGLLQRATLALARAQRRAGDATGAFATLRALAGAFESPGAARPEPYWAAWAEMLEIQADENGDGSRTEDIRLQIRRLELLDPSLGGGEHAERIRAVRDGLK